MQLAKKLLILWLRRIKVPWTEPEIEHDVKGVMAFSPDRETSIPFDGDGYMLNQTKTSLNVKMKDQKRWE